MVLKGYKGSTVCRNESILHRGMNDKRFQQASSGRQASAFIVRGRLHATGVCQASGRASRYITRMVAY